MRWSTAKDLLVQSDGRLRELADHGELDMNDSAVLAAFIQRGVRVRGPLGELTKEDSFARSCDISIRCALMRDRCATILRARS